MHRWNACVVERRMVGGRLELADCVDRESMVLKGCLGQWCSKLAGQCAPQALDE
jgi:hypothetical protein